MHLGCVPVHAHACACACWTGPPRWRRGRGKGRLLPSCLAPANSFQCDIPLGGGVSESKAQMVDGRLASRLPGGGGGGGGRRGCMFGWSLQGNSADVHDQRTPEPDPTPRTVQGHARMPPGGPPFPLQALRGASASKPPPSALILRKDSLVVKAEPLI